MTYAEKQRFDLVLIDAKLPDADGPTTATLLRQLPSVGQGTPIVALVADGADAADVAKSSSAITEVLAKPITTAAIERVLGQFTPQALLKDKPVVEA